MQFCGSHVLSLKVALQAAHMLSGQIALINSQNGHSHTAAQYMTANITTLKYEGAR